MNLVLIDDDPITLFLTKTILELEGFSEKITDFEDPEKALGLLQLQIEKGQLPKLIFLDLNMPKISGWDFLDALEPYSEQLHAKCLIYILTSSLDPSDIARAKEYPHVKELIHKPLDRNKVYQIRENMVRNERKIDF